MQGRKDIQPKMMYQVNIDKLVPIDNFYRKLSHTLDLSFLYKATAKYYGSEGQESIDPVVFFKICLIGYLNNIMSSANKHVLLLPFVITSKKDEILSTQNQFFNKYLAGITLKNRNPHAFFLKHSQVKLS